MVAGAKQQDNLVRGKLRAMVVAYANPEQSVQRVIFGAPV
jgi:hypothetical protein